MNATRSDIERVGLRLRNGSLSCEALTRACLEGIHSLNPRIGALITVCEQAAIDSAKARDRELVAGRDRGPLHGIPIVYKDNIDTAGIRSTIGSKIFENRVPEQDADVVTVLAAAGTVALGKANMNELAAGGPGGFNKFFGSTHNPWHIEHESGGSSSGSGAAVASGMCLGGIGSDSGGSIRGPASHMGIVGIRPTTGRVSNAGIFPRAPTFDVCGPLARTVSDAALLLGPLVGQDVLGAALAKTFPGNRDTFRIGLIAGYYEQDVDAEVLAAFHQAVCTLQAIGAEVIEIEVPEIQSGHVASVATDLLVYEFRMVFGAFYEGISDPELVGSVVHRDMARAAELDATRYQDALRARSALAEKFRQLFTKVDAIATPTMPTPAPLLEKPDVSGNHRRFTIPFSFAGQPVLSVRCGFSSAGLPIGLQLVGACLQEARLIQIALAYETATQEHPVHPPHWLSIAEQ